MRISASERRSRTKACDSNPGRRGTGGEHYKPGASARRRCAARFPAPRPQQSRGCTTSRSRSCRPGPGSRYAPRSQSRLPIRDFSQPKIRKIKYLSCRTKQRTFPYSVSPPFTLEMPRMTRSASFAVAAVLACLIPLAAQAGSKTRTRTKIVGHTAVASWDYVEGDVQHLRQRGRHRKQLHGRRRSQRRRVRQPGDQPVQHQHRQRAHHRRGLRGWAVQLRLQRRQAAGHRHAARPRRHLPGRQQLHLLQRRHGSDLDGDRRGVHLEVEREVHGPGLRA